MFVIAVDTGNRFMKTAHAEPFCAGLVRHYDTPPIVSSDTLFYDGNYYTFSDEQGFHRQDKTTDDYYFILSLAAIAREIIMKSAMIATPIGREVDFATAMQEAVKRQPEFNEMIYLSVGLPPRDMKVQSQKLKAYYMRNGETLRFTYNGIKFNIRIADVFVSPQGFAAVYPSDQFARVSAAPQSYIIDIGGYTTDIARIVNQRMDTSFFESLDFGVIHLYNEIKSMIGRDFQLQITTVHIEAILHGQSINYPAIEEAVRKASRTYARKIVDALRDKGMDLTLSVPVLVGGGSLLLHDALDAAIGNPSLITIPDVRANAIGYEAFANMMLQDRKRV